MQQHANQAWLAEKTGKDMWNHRTPHLRANRSYEQAQMRAAVRLLSRRSGSTAVPVPLLHTWLVTLDRWMGLRSAVRAPNARPALPGTISSDSRTTLGAWASCSQQQGNMHVC